MPGIFNILQNYKSFYCMKFLIVLFLLPLSVFSQKNNLQKNDTASTFNSNSQDEGKKYYDKAMALSGKYTKQLQLLEKASDLGYLPANNQLFFYYHMGVYHSFPADCSKALAFITRSAVAGDSSGMMIIADCYATGECTPRNFDKGIEWYEKAAEAGYVSAMIKLGEIYTLPYNSGRDSAKSYKWYALAGSAGDVESQLKAGAMEAIHNKDCEKFMNLKLYYEGSHAGCGQCSYQMYLTTKNSDFELAMIYLDIAKAQGVPIKDEEYAELRNKQDEKIKNTVYPGYINSNAPGAKNSNTSSGTKQPGQSKCPYCKGAGQLKVEGQKGSYTDSYGHQHSTYEALHWVSCSHCKGTGYISQ